MEALTVKQLLQNDKVFSLLAESETERLVECLKPISFQAGETVMERGDKASGIYIIAEGRARIVSGNGSDAPILTFSGPGDSFGDLSLLTRTPVSATVEAAENLELLRLDPKDFSELLNRTPELRDALIQRQKQQSEFNFLRTLNFLSDLDRREIQALLDVIETLQLVAGETLFREGDPGDAAYIVRTGTIKIIKESAQNAELGHLETGALLGEMALRSNEPRNATARAQTDSVVLRLRKPDYDRIAAGRTVNEVIAKQATQRWLAHDTLLYNASSAEGRAALLRLIHGENGIDKFWKRARQEKQLPEQALKTLAHATGLDYLTPSSQLLIDPDLVQKIPPQYARANQVLPVFQNQDRLDLLVNTPFLGTVPAELSHIWGGPINLRLTEPQFLAKLIDSIDTEGDAIAGSLSDIESSDNWEELDSIEDLKDQAQAAPIIKLVNNVFMEAISRNASDIHIEPYEEGLEVRYRVDGILQLISTAPRRFQAAIVSRIKIMSNLDISERRIPQDGRIALRLEAKNFDIRVATVPTVFGESVVMRILDKSSVQIQIAEIGFSPPMLADWKTVVSQPNGVVLVTGPTGSGKTTSLYATLNHVKSTEVKIITAEDPVEYQLHGIKQIQVDNKVNLTFAAALRSMLRLDPDIIMVGEIRDKETAEIAIQAALTGHLVFSTLHTNDAPSALTRLAEMGIAPYLVASAVTAVLAQRLVRKLCTSCKQQDSEGNWQAIGCNQCEGSGYKGRLGIYQLMIVNDAIRELIIQNRDATVLAAEAERQGMASLRSDGLLKIAQGLTTADELRRITG